MHAVVVHVTLNDVGGSESILRDEVVPRISERTGFVAGYWTQKDNTGISMTIWESEGAANSASEMIRPLRAPEGVKIDSVEVRRVVASA